MAGKTVWVVMQAQTWSALTHPNGQNAVRLVGEHQPDRWLPVFLDKESALTSYPTAQLMECEMPGIEEPEPNSEEE